MAEEPSIQPAPSPIERKANHGLDRLAGMLGTVVALLFLVFVVLSLVGLVVDAEQALVKQHDYTGAAARGADGAFLAIILLELVHTTLSRETITRQVQEFLAVGIASGIRAGLEVAADARGHDSRSTAIGLAINSCGVLLLVLALAVVRRMVKEAPRHSDRGDA